MSPRIQQILDTALEQLRAALLEEASQAVRNALGDDGPIPIPYGRGRAKPGPKPNTGRRPKGAKRTPEELEALTKSLLAAIKKKPGQRVEEIAKGLNTTTKELQLPAIKLWEAKSIRTTGQKRATRYFPK